MKKIDLDFTKNAYNSFVEQYFDATKNVGLWNSEKDLVLNYFKNIDGKVLDMGCGVGRTSFGLEMLGFNNIVAIDLSNEMINQAKCYGNYLNSKVLFEEGNCCCINYGDNTFDYALFSFNGLMQIPKSINRLLALKELFRVLKSGGFLIFTTHDRNFGSNAYLDQWSIERRLWIQDKQDNRLHDFGDVIIDKDDQEYFINIPTYKEVENLINNSGFTLLDSFIRSTRYDENQSTKEFSDDCRFWIVKKI